jgi:hypothetical protein
LLLLQYCCWCCSAVPITMAHQRLLPLNTLLLLLLLLLLALLLPL